MRSGLYPLPGPASTQLAIFCAWRLRGDWCAGRAPRSSARPDRHLGPGRPVPQLRPGVGSWARGGGRRRGPGVGIHAGVGLTARLAAPKFGSLGIYLLAGAAAAAGIVLRCGAARLRPVSSRYSCLLCVHSGKLPSFAVPRCRARSAAGSPLLAWVASEVGALSYGGGFVIIPLMQSNAVGHYHWMTGAESLNAVALGRSPPAGRPDRRCRRLCRRWPDWRDPRVSHRLQPLFRVHPARRPRFDQIRSDRQYGAFLTARPAAIGAVFGSAIPLARALTHSWQYAILAARWSCSSYSAEGVVLTLLCAAATESSSP